MVESHLAIRWLLRIRYPDYKVKEEDSTRVRFYGHKTEDGIFDLAASGKNVRSMGIATGRSEGEVLELLVKRDGCDDYWGKGVKTMTTAGDGDSGGPTYEVDYVAGTGTVAYYVSMNNRKAGNLNSGSCNSDSYSYDPIVGTKSLGMSFYALYNYFDGYGDLEGLHIAVPDSI
ncbi:MAG: hypothetical protein ABEI57_02960 [Halapricum sp.]